MRCKFLDNKKLLIDICSDMGFYIDDFICDKFFKYKELLIEWNKKFNLTAITDEKEIIIKHFIDSIFSLKGIEFKNTAKVIDVGTGAGFPGLPIKIMRPDISLVLMDSLLKRINFLQSVVDELKLEKVLCVHSRAEDAAREDDFRESFDICLSRAVAYLPSLLEFTLPFVKIGGYFIALKGSDIDEEIEQSNTALSVLGGRIKNIVEYDILDIKHKLIIVEKISNTPLKYPRRAGKINKNFIK